MSQISKKKALSIFSGVILKPTSEKKFDIENASKDELMVMIVKYWWVMPQQTYDLFYKKSIEQLKKTYLESKYYYEKGNEDTKNTMKIQKIQ